MQKKAIGKRLVLRNETHCLASHEDPEQNFLGSQNFGEFVFATRPLDVLGAIERSREWSHKIGPGNQLLVI